MEQVAFSHWDTDHPGAAGLHTKDFKLDHATVFEVGASDGRIGEVAAGPVIVARPGKPKIVVLGFHPVLTGMRYELATPLLFANLLRWIAPEIFRRYEISGGSVGAVKLVLDQDTAAARREGDGGRRIGAAVHDARPHAEFLCGLAGWREGGCRRPRVPLLADAAGAVGIEVDAARGCASRGAAVHADYGIVDGFVAVAGAGGSVGLLAEWILYGRFRARHDAHRRRSPIRGCAE